MKSWFVTVYVACCVMVLWTAVSRTELAATDPETGLRLTRPTSIVGMAEGTVIKPFVFRRLLPDVARLISGAVPDPFWNAVRNAIRPGAPLFGRVGEVFERQLGWSLDNLPLLLTAHVLVWLSIVGFIRSVQALAAVFHEVTPGFSTRLGAAFGVALLGGMGEKWDAYAYDYPNAFVFTLTLWAIAARRDRVFWPSFLAAVYSKETSLLLIVAWGVARRRELPRRSLALHLAVLAVLYVAIRGWIQYRFSGAPDAVHWYPAHNATLLVHAAYELIWVWAILGIVVARVFRLRRKFPTLLMEWLVLVPILVLPAFFKGWIDERRGYIELLPVVGLIVTGWASLEMGWGDRFRPRPESLQWSESSRGESVESP